MSAKCCCGNLLFLDRERDISPLLSRVNKKKQSISDLICLENSSQKRRSFFRSGTAEKGNIGKMIAQLDSSKVLGKMIRYYYFCHKTESMERSGLYCHEVEQESHIRALY
jgi:hypothetical protein